MRSVRFHPVVILIVALVLAEVLIPFVILDWRPMRDAVCRNNLRPTLPLTSHYARQTRPHRAIPRQALPSHTSPYRNRQTTPYRARPRQASPSPTLPRRS